MKNQIKSGYSLSPGQQRLWQLAQRDGAQTYLVSVDFKTSGVAENVLCQALATVMARHEILRMEFGVLPGMELPVQAAAQTPPVVKALAPQRFAIQEDWQLCLQKLSQDNYRLGLSSLCADAQTALLLLAEIGELLEYDAEAMTTVARNDEELPFTSLAQWQHDMLADTTLSETQDVQLPTWNESNSLSRSGRLPEWPFLRRQRQPGSCIKRQHLKLDSELNSALFHLAGQVNAPLEHLLYLAWSLLLYRLNPSCPAVAYQASGRAYDEMSTAIGPLARFIPLNFHLAPHTGFATLLQALSRHINEVTALQDYITSLDSNHGLAAGFSWQAMHSTIGRLSVESLFSWSDDCFIVLAGFADEHLRLQLYFDFDMAVCEPGCMQNLEEEFLTMLTSIVQAPQQSADTLVLLGPDERHLLLNEFSGPAVAATPHWQAPVQEIMRCLQQHPGHVFISAPEGQLDGAVLAQRIHDISGHLLSVIHADAISGKIIAVLLDRSADMVASLLAIQLAGAAYLPLDTAYPEERISYMLQDSGARLLVTTTAMAAQLRLQPAFHNLIQQVSIVTVDDLPVRLKHQGPESLPALQQGDLAYLIYTSGSTGQPKAVAVPHGALANHMRWMLRELPLHGDDTVLQKTAISFDASVWEIFAPLMAGARLALARPGVERDPEQLLRSLQEENITVLQLVPSMLRMLAEQPALAACPRLRRLCCGGEALDAGLARKVLAALPEGAECINLYGPTETTVQVVFERIHVDDEVVAIGKPIDNTCIYVLDEYLQLQPVGVRGELYVAGPSLAQGYYQREALTAERFVADPFRSGGARMYRTGDIGAWRTDGRLDCFGRADRQVKLRGYRVELEEIEAIIRAQPDIIMAVALLDRDAADIDQLLCFYTLKPGASLQQSDLKQVLAAALPEYMLPNWLIAVDAFPFMPNGKVDHKALLKLRPVHTTASQAPRDTLEMRLERIWESVLHVSQVGINSNFFDLGGHSLLAVRLMAEIEKEFGHRLPLTSLFSAPTVAAQAALLRNESLQLDPVLVPIRTGNAQCSPLVLVHPTGGSVLCYRALAGGLTTERPVVALQDPGLMGEANYQSVEELATLYLDKIQALVRDRRYLLAGWSSGGIIAYEMARQAMARGYEIAFLCLIDSQVAPLVESAPPRDRLLRSISRLIAHKAELDCPDLSGLPFEAALQNLLELAREADFVAPHADEKEIEKLFQVFEKNVTVIGRYTAGPLPRRTLLMKATQALPDAIREAAVHYRPEDKHLGWDKLCFVKVRNIHGDHMSMMETPKVSAVVEALDQELKEVERLHGLERQMLMPMLGL